MADTVSSQNDPVTTGESQQDLKPQIVESKENEENQPLSSPNTRTSEIPQDAASPISSKIIGTFIYEPTMLFPCFREHVDQVLRMKIPRIYLSRDNPRVIERGLWGTDVYTDDSDVVAMLFHAGFLNDEPVEHDWMVDILILPSLKQGYLPSERNGVTSRAWLQDEHDGVSWKIIRVKKCQGRVMEAFKSRKSRMSVHAWWRRQVQRSASEDVSILFDDNGNPCLKFSLAAVTRLLHRSRNRTVHFMTLKGEKFTLRPTKPSYFELVHDSDSSTAIPRIAQKDVAWTIHGCKIKQQIYVISSFSVD